MLIMCLLVPPKGHNNSICKNGFPIFLFEPVEEIWIVMVLIDSHVRPCFLHIFEIFLAPIVKPRGQKIFDCPFCLYLSF